MSTTPKKEGHNAPHLDALAPLARMLAPLVAAELVKLGGAAPDRPYSQNDGERPVGCGRVRYLRIWRAAAAAGDVGATEDGRARLLTVEAYQRHAGLRARAPKTPPSAPVPLPAAEDDVLDALGLRRVS